MGAVDTRPVPTNLFRWPRTRDLISQQKGIFSYLWFHPDQTACGCYLLPLDATAADLSMTTSSLADAMSEFKRRKLVDIDEETGEILLPDWFRWYFPGSAAAHGAVNSAIRKILSTDLRRKAESLYKTNGDIRKGLGKVLGKGSSSNKEELGLPPGWWTSEKGTTSAGQKLGLAPNPGESLDEFRARVRAALAKKKEKAA